MYQIAKRPKFVSILIKRFQLERMQGNCVRLKHTCHQLIVNGKKSTEWLSAPEQYGTIARAAVWCSSKGTAIVSN